MGAIFLLINALRQEKEFKIYLTKNLTFRASLFVFIKTIIIDVFPFLLFYIFFLFFFTSISFSFFLSLWRDTLEICSFESIRLAEYNIFIFESIKLTTPEMCTFDWPHIITTGLKDIYSILFNIPFKKMLTPFYHFISFTGWYNNINSRVPLLC